jgi:hypothetical protein
LPQATCWDVAMQQPFLLSPMQLILFKESCQCNLDSINHVGIFFSLVGVEGFQPSASFFSQFSKMQDLRHWMWSICPHEWNLECISRQQVSLMFFLFGAGSLINRISWPWTVALYAQSLIFLLMMFDVFAVLHYNQGWAWLPWWKAHGQYSSQD